MDKIRVWKTGGMKLMGENQNSWMKPYPSAIFSTTSPNRLA
jgi:hypothetical protein